MRSSLHRGRAAAARRHAPLYRTPPRRLLRSTVAESLLVLGLAVPAASAQQRPSRVADAIELTAAALLVGSVVADQNVHAFVAERHTPTLDAVAVGVDPLGRARYLVPALAGTYVASRVAGAERWSHVILHTGLAYAVSDAVEAILKPTVGRHRPSAADDPARFRPFSAGEEWHSFPSAHTVHAFSIAAALSAEAHNPWVTAAAYGAASAVGLQRVYRDAHWSSDVVGSAILAIVTSRATVRWLHGRARTRSNERRVPSNE